MRQARCLRVRRGGILDRRFASLTTRQVAGSGEWTHGLTRDESIRLVVYKDSCGQSWAVHELGLGAQLLRNAQAVQTRINSLEDGALPPKTRLVWVAAVGVRVQLARADARPWQLCVRLPIRLRG